MRLHAQHKKDIAGDFICLKSICCLTFPFKVILPTGTTVIVENDKRSIGGVPTFINVWISASPFDYRETRGKNYDFGERN